MEHAYHLQLNEEALCCARSLSAVCTINIGFVPKFIVTRYRQCREAPSNATDDVKDCNRQEELTVCVLKFLLSGRQNVPKDEERAL